MTTAEVKEWLTQVRAIDKEVTALLNARDITLAQCTSITARPKEIDVLGSTDPRGDDPWIKYAELEADINEKIDTLCDTKREILAAIQRVNDGALRTLLVERYINVKTWEQVAEDMGYAWAQIHRLHGQALNVIKDGME